MWFAIIILVIGAAVVIGSRTLGNNIEGASRDMAKSKVIFYINVCSFFIGIVYGWGWSGPEHAANMGYLAVPLYYRCFHALLWGFLGLFFGYIILFCLLFYWLFCWIF